MKIAVQVSFKKDSDFEDLTRYLVDKIPLVARRVAMGDKKHKVYSIDTFPIEISEDYLEVRRMRSEMLDQDFITSFKTKEELVKSAVKGILTLKEAKVAFVTIKNARFNSRQS